MQSGQEALDDRARLEIDRAEPPSRAMIAGSR
jgi:hypothetical protein